MEVLKIERVGILLLIRVLSEKAYLKLRFLLLHKETKIVVYAKIRLYEPSLFYKFKPRSNVSKLFFLY